MLKQRFDSETEEQSEAVERLCARFGLNPRDLTPAAFVALRALAEERDAMQERLAAAEDLADRDMLTPTLNRRAFMRELHRSMSELERYGVQAAVIYIDLDGFKSINDSYGHAAGDEVLRAIARLLTENTRESDVVGRLGGDEFAIILNRVDPEDARAKASALGAAVRRAKVEYKGVIHCVQASVGLHFVAAPEDPEIALARADEAMYARKHARR